MRNFNTTINGAGASPSFCAIAVKEKPLLSLLLLMMAGIFVRMMLFVPPYGVSGVTAALLILLVMTVALRRFSAISSVFLLSGCFALGVLLASESCDRGYAPLVSLPVAGDVEESMSVHRDRLLATYAEAGLSDDVLAVVSAMTLGERHGVSSELRQAYSVTGAAHVFALSGLHLSIIFMFLTLLLPTRAFPVVSTVVQLVLLWTFVFLVGLHPSILRAAVMFTCYSLCRLLSRAARSSDVLALTAVLLLIYNPQWLFDVGFQMSFMAMVGIFLIYPRLSSLLPRHDSLPLRGSRTGSHQLSLLCVSLLHRAIRYAWSILAVTMSATLGTAPLIAHYFGRLSLYSLLANLVVSPCATLILFLSFLLLLSSCLSRPLALLAGSFPESLGTLFSSLSNLFTSLGTLFAMLLDGVVRAMNRSVQWLSTLPGASIEGISITFAQTILIYIAVACAIFAALSIRRAMLRG